MSNYIKTKVYLSESQKGKLRSAFKNGDEISLQINKSKSPNHEMLLTQTQIKQVGQGKRIKISKTQLKKNGGFLPFLIPILLAAGKAIASGALAGAAGYGVKKVLDKVSGSGCCKKKTSRKRSDSELGISNETIEENMKYQKGFRGVFTIDLLPKKVRRFENGIINLDISTGKGTHWVCYYNDPKFV